MKQPAFITAIIIGLCPALLPGGAALAQESREEMPTRYRNWIEQDVAYIATKEEIEAFYQLTDNELRNKFIEIFWEKRDPTPGTTANEFRDEHYKRIEYANKFFGPRSQKNGWRTERGRMYIMFGPPKERLEYANDALLYPLELWFYAAESKLESVQFFYLIFYKQGGASDYVLYHPLLDGPKALTWKGNFDYSDQEIMEALETLNPELAQASTSYDVLDRDNPLGSEMVIGQIDAYIERTYDGSWATEFVKAKGKVDVAYTFKAVTVDSTFMIHTQPNGRQQFHYGFMLFPQDVELGKHEDKYYGVFVLIPSLADKEGKLIWQGSRKVELDWTEEEYSVNRSKAMMFLDAIPVIPGRYTFTLRVRNEVSKKYFMITREINTPMPLNEELTLTEPLLSYQQNKLEGQQQSGAFRVFNVDYAPSPTNKFANTESIHVYTECYYKPSDAPTNKIGDISIEYNIYRGSELVKKMTHIVSKERLNNFGVLYVSRQLPLEDLNAGKYSLEIIATESAQNRTSKQTATFEIAQPDNILRPKLFNLAQNADFDSGKLLLELARQLSGAGYQQQAINEYRRVLEQDTGNVTAAIELGRLLMDAGKAEEGFELVNSMQHLDPNNRDMIIFLADANFAQERFQKALAFYERYLFIDPNDVEILNRAARLYQVVGDVDKAREYFKRSLAIDNNQPEIERQLASLEE